MAGRRIHQHKQVAPQQLVSLVAVAAHGRDNGQAARRVPEVLASKVEMHVQTAQMQTFKQVVAAVVPAVLVELVHQQQVVPEAMALARP